MPLCKLTKQKIEIKIVLSEGILRKFAIGVDCCRTPSLISVITVSLMYRNLCISTNKGQTPLKFKIDTSILGSFWTLAMQTQIRRHRMRATSDQGRHCLINLQEFFVKLTTNRTTLTLICDCLFSNFANAWYVLVWEAIFLQN